MSLIDRLVVVAATEDFFFFSMSWAMARTPATCERISRAALETAEASGPVNQSGKTRTTPENNFSGEGAVGHRCGVQACAGPALANTYVRQVDNKNNASDVPKN